MLQRTENKWGKIDIERPVAAKVVKEAILSLPDVYAITNANGNASAFISKLTFDRNSDYIRIDKNKDGGILIEINLILYFGRSISEVTGLVSEHIRRDLMEYLELDPEELVINVVGLKTSAKRGKVLQRNITYRDKR